MLAQRRRDLGLSLRAVEEKTGINNAHVSQIETGAIDQPAPNLLWELSVASQLDFKKLIRLAGLDRGAKRGAMLNAAFRALDELTPAQQAEALNYLEELRGAGGRRK